MFAVLTFRPLDFDSDNRYLWKSVSAGLDSVRTWASLLHEAGAGQRTHPRLPYCLAASPLAAAAVQPHEDAQPHVGLLSSGSASICRYVVAGSWRYTEMTSIAALPQPYIFVYWPALGRGRVPALSLCMHPVMRGPGTGGGLMEPRAPGGRRNCGARSRRRRRWRPWPRPGPPPPPAWASLPARPAASAPREPPLHLRANVVRTLWHPLLRVCLFEASSHRRVPTGLAEAVFFILLERMYLTKFNSYFCLSSIERSPLGDC